MLGLVRYEAETCRGCGHHPSLMDPEKHVYAPADYVCPNCANLAPYLRAQEARDRREREANNLDKHAPEALLRIRLAADGRTTGMRLLDPIETAAAKARTANDQRGR